MLLWRVMRTWMVAGLLLVGTACSTSEEAKPASALDPATAAADGRTTVVGQAPAGAVVTLDSVTAGERPLPPGPAILDQYSRNFVPDLLLVRVGQRVEFRNSEDIDHNVAVIRSPTGTKVFDTSTPPYQKYEHTFDRAGRYDVSCDIHPGMRATIVAITAPHATVVDQTGRFTFADIEPGPYTLNVTTSARSMERRIDVAGARMDLGAVSP
jgi:plastocyanin